jgi:hypothetical protein
VFEWVTLGRSLAYLGAEAVAYFTLALWLDYDSRHGASAAAAAHACAWLARWAALACAILGTTTLPGHSTLPCIPHEHVQVFGAACDGMADADGMHGWRGRMRGRCWQGLRRGLGKQGAAAQYAAVAGEAEGQAVQMADLEGGPLRGHQTNAEGSTWDEEAQAPVGQDPVPCTIFLPCSSCPFNSGTSSNMSEDASWASR